MHHLAVPRLLTAGWLITTFGNVLGWPQLVYNRFGVACEETVRGHMIACVQCHWYTPDPVHSNACGWKMVSPYWPALLVFFFSLFRFRSFVCLLLSRHTKRNASRTARLYTVWRSCCHREVTWPAARRGYVIIIVSQLDLVFFFREFTSTTSCQYGQYTHRTGSLSFSCSRRNTARLAP